MDSESRRGHSLMKLYLVRHGSTKDAEEGSLQTPDSSLGVLGKKQAKAVAARLAKEARIDLVASSNTKRTQQTAEIIARKLDREIELFEGIHERRCTTKMYSVHKDSKQGQEYVSALRNNLVNLDWRFDKEEESMRELVERALKFRKHLFKNHLGQNLVVVSHSFFLGAFLAVVILGEDYTDVEFVKFFRSLRLDNGGLSVVEYDEGSDSWRIVVMNEHEYLRGLLL